MKNILLIVSVAVVPLLAQEMNVQQAVPVSTIFPRLVRFDSDNDGRLSQQERKNADTMLKAEEEQLQARYKACRDEMDTLRGSTRTSYDYLDRFDADNDGQLSPQEKEIAIKTINAETKQRHERFTALRKEMGEIHQELRQVRLTRLDWQLYKSYDADGNGMLDAAELAKKKANDDAERAAFLEKFDLNKDGKVTWEEQKAVQANNAADTHLED